MNLPWLTLLAALPALGAVVVVLTGRVDVVDLVRVVELHRRVGHQVVELGGRHVVALGRGGQRVVGGHGR